MTASGSRFLSSLIVEKLGGSDWRLVIDLVFYSAHFNRQFIAPKGLVTDFASVPRVPFVFDLMGDTMHLPAAIHDELYRNCAKEGVSRADADYVLREAALATQEAPWRAQAVFAAVRTFGGQHWPCGAAAGPTNPPDSGLGNSRALGLKAPPWVRPHLIRPAQLAAIEPLHQMSGLYHPIYKEIIR